MPSFEELAKLGDLTKNISSLMTPQVAKPSFSLKMPEIPQIRNYQMADYQL